MESRLENTITGTGNEGRAAMGDKLLEDLKGVIQRAEQKAVERAKAADRVVREHPYQTVALALGVGILIGVLAARRK
jgi:ElaB/YqjD/DUF883 family membrane-anchored ribosome-binding protein